MKTKFFLTSIILLIAYLSSPAAVIKEKRELKDFDGIRVSAGIEVQFSQKNSYRVEIEGEEEDVKEIDLKITKSTLNIGWKENNKKRNTRKKVIIHVDAPNLYEIDASSGSDFNSDKINSGKNFNITASSGADIDIEKLEVKEHLNIDLSSGSSCDIDKITTQTSNFSTSSGAGIKIESIKAEKVQADASSGASIKIGSSITDEFQADASSAGRISIEGEFKIQHTTSSSGGRIYVNGKNYK